MWEDPHKRGSNQKANKQHQNGEKKNGYAKERGREDLKTKKKDQLEENGMDLATTGPGAA